MLGGVTAQHHPMNLSVPTFRRSPGFSSAVRPGGRPLHNSLSTTEATTDRRTNLTTCTGSEIILKTEYEDSWFGRLAIRHLSSSIEAITGGTRREEGYDGLVEAASIITTRYGGKEQQEVVVAALDKAFPAAVMAMLKAFLPQSKFSREFFAIFTKLFFSWLVGHCEVKESDFHGKREKNVVYIPKCRFLEATNCVGMCTNLCKIPSQKFISDSLGMPTNMIPNFEDKSCEIIFGQHPPADDPALKQPCYRTTCIARKKHGVGCSS